MCVLFAATYPQRARSLVLYGSYARRLRADDYPWAPTWEERQRVAADLERGWGENVDLSTMIPDADPLMAAWFQRRARAAVSPAAARDLILMNSKADVRAALGLVQCPTLVLHRTGDLDSRVEEGRYLADHIPGARFVELPGPDHVPWVRMEEVLDPVEEFLTGSRRTAVADRVLTTILFTDLGQFDRPGPRTRGRGLGVAAGPARQGGACGARRVRRRGGGQGRRRLPVTVHRTGTGDQVRAGHRSVVAHAGSGRSRRRAHRRGRAKVIGTVRNRGPPGRSGDGGRGRRRGAGHPDDARPRRGLRAGLRGPRGLHPQGHRGRPAALRRLGVIRRVGPWWGVVDRGRLRTFSGALEATVGSDRRPSPQAGEISPATTSPTWRGDRPARLSGPRRRVQRRRRSHLVVGPVLRLWAGRFCLGLRPATMTGMAERGLHPAGTLGGLRAARRREVFVGREAEVDLFRSALGDDGPAFGVLFVHGPAGVGKSDAAGRVRGDRGGCGRRGGPGRRPGRWRARRMTSSTRSPKSGRSPTVTGLIRSRSGARLVLLIDGYEWLGHLDGWVRERLLPRLPASTRGGARGPRAAAS